MIKKIVVSLSLLFSLTSLAQEGTSSPYSFYGIGDIKFKGAVDTRSMGGLTVFPDSIHLNLQNPAHLAGLKLTSFAVGSTYANTKLQSETASGKARRTSLDYLAVGIPVGKFGVGFGLIPYSSVGYKLQSLTSDENPTFSRYSGVGGVNKVFAGLGYKITEQINVGVTAQYNFGTIETTNLRYLESVQYGTRENNMSDLQGFNLDFGLSYQAKINDKLSLFSSVTFSPESTLNLDNSRSIDLIQFLSNGNTSTVQSEEVTVENTEIKIPTKWSFGIGVGQLKKWMLGGEITLINNSVMSNRFNDIEGAAFENSTRYVVGGYFIPNYNSYSGYFKRIVYRAGLRYENTGLVLQNKSITDAAMNLGLGLPLNGTFSNINVNFEYGKRGTTYSNLVEENYFNISIGLSLSDKWFVKRKFD